MKRKTDEMGEVKFFETTETFLLELTVVEALSTRDLDVKKT